MKRYGRPASIVTDRLKSYRAAMKVMGNEGCQETRRWLNNRAENSHQGIVRLKTNRSPKTAVLVRG